MKKSPYPSIIVIFTILTLSSSAAVALNLDAVAGQWHDPQGDGALTTYQAAAVTYGSGQEQQVRWGAGAGADGAQSGLGFAATATPLPLAVGDVFEIGQLRHFNNPIFAGTEAAAVQLSLDLTFAGLNLATQAFDFRFNIDETLNVDDSPASDDLIDFSDALPTQTFDVDGQTYTLELLGFGLNPDQIQDHFRSAEGATNATRLFARITTPPADLAIPEPGTAILLGIGMLLLAYLTRRTA